MLLANELEVDSNAPLIWNPNFWMALVSDGLNSKSNHFHKNISENSSCHCDAPLRGSLSHLPLVRAWVLFKYSETLASRHPSTLIPYLPHFLEAKDNYQNQLARGMVKLAK